MNGTDMSQVPTPEEQRKIQAINQFSEANINGVSENFSLIREVNDFLLRKPRSLEPKLADKLEKPEMPLGWFDVVIEKLRVINCRNTDINLQLKKLHRETIDK